MDSDNSSNTNTRTKTLRTVEYVMARLLFNSIEKRLF